MKRKLIIVGGAASLLGLTCAGIIFFTGAAGWLLTPAKRAPRIIQIAPLAPLATSWAASVTPSTAKPAAPEPATPIREVAMPEPGEQTISPPTVPIEQILGFSLPAGSVNSVTAQGVATRLIIPKLNLDAPVVISPIKDQTWQVDHLEQAVGHLEGTAPPGANSNIVLAGHVTLREGVYGPFAGLGQLIPGDLLTVYEGNQKFNYVVDDYTVVDRTAVEVTYPTDTPQITLITCSRWNQQDGRYEQRLVVKGHLATP
jgi:LPXTG-site transpeptidase (sortase) family protein